MELGTTKLELFVHALMTMRTGLVARLDYSVPYTQTVFDPGGRKLREFYRSPAAVQCCSTSASLRPAVSSSTELRNTATTIAVLRDNNFTIFAEDRFAIISSTKSAVSTSYEKSAVERTGYKKFAAVTTSYKKFAVVRTSYEKSAAERTSYKKSAARYKLHEVRRQDDDRYSTSMLKMSYSTYL